MTKLIVAFCNFEKAPKNCSTFHLSIFSVAAIRLCVLQTEVGSLQSPDCDT
jgi:hypothetical protein